MRDYHAEALQFIKESDELSLELVNSQLERFGYLLKDSAPCNHQQLLNIKKTIELLKNTAAEMATDSGVELSTESEIDTSSIAPPPYELDSSPLGGFADTEPVILSKSEKAKALDSLLQSPLISRGGNVAVSGR